MRAHISRVLADVISAYILLVFFTVVDNFNHRG